MDEQRLSRLVRQHAETSRLLGVDFVPRFRRAAAAVVEVKPEPEHEPERGPRTAAAGAAGGAAGGVAGGADAPDSVVMVTAGSRAEALEALRERYVREAPHGAFVTAHTNIVFGEGDPSARLMFVGEAPVAEEDRTGRPFVGRAGQLLDKMIVAMGLSRERVYIANVLKTRPPDNRTPTLDEARACAPYLYEQIRIVSPEVIVTLGKSAGQLLLSSTESMGNLRGHWAWFPPDDPLCDAGEIAPIPVMPTYHPAFLLRSYTPENRARVWSDLRQVMERLGLEARPG